MKGDALHLLNASLGLQQITRQSRERRFVYCGVVSSPAKREGKVMRDQVQTGAADLESWSGVERAVAEPFI